MIPISTPRAITPTIRPRYSGMKWIARQMFFTPAPGDRSERSGRSAGDREARTVAWIRPGASKDVPVPGRVAKRGLSKLFALSPADRGEGIGFAFRWDL